MPKHESLAGLRVTPTCAFQKLFQGLVHSIEAYPSKRPMRRILALVRDPREANTRSLVVVGLRDSLRRCSLPVIVAVIACGWMLQPERPMGQRVWPTVRMSQHLHGTKTVRSEFRIVRRPHAAMEVRASWVHPELDGVQSTDCELRRDGYFGWRMPAGARLRLDLVGKHGRARLVDPETGRTTFVASDSSRVLHPRLPLTQPDASWGREWRKGERRRAKARTRALRKNEPCWVRLEQHEELMRFFRWKDPSIVTDFGSEPLVDGKARLLAKPTGQMQIHAIARGIVIPLEIASETSESTTLRTPPDLARIRVQLRGASGEVAPNSVTTIGSLPVTKPDGWPAGATWSLAFLHDSAAIRKHLEPMTPRNELRLAGLVDKPLALRIHDVSRLAEETQLVAYETLIPRKRHEAFELKLDGRWIRVSLTDGLEFGEIALRFDGGVSIKVGHVIRGLPKPFWIVRNATHIELLDGRETIRSHALRPEQASVRFD